MKVMDKVPEATITSKGQITIPKSERDFLGVGPGDRLKFFRDAHGHVVMLPKIPISALAGILKSPLKKTVTQKEMDDAIADGAVARYERSNDRS